MAGSVFYGMVAYAVTVTAVLSAFGIRVGKRLFYRRGPGPIPAREDTSPTAFPALEGGQQPVDLVPERRAPPQDPLAEELFGDVMMRVLGRSRNTNPFLY